MATQTYEQLKLENQLCFPLYAASRTLVQKYTPLLRPLGITYTQYLVLLVLWEEDHLTVSQLCSKLYLDSGTVTPLLKKMEQEGILERKRSDTDERVVIISLTEKGEQLKEQAQNIPYQVGSCLDLSADEAASLYSVLYKIIGECAK